MEPETLPLGRLVPRHALRVTEVALADTRVVLVNGPRQAGKSTLVRQILAQRPGAVERRLDRPEVRAAALDDPSAFLDHDGLMAIDEVQRAPELLLSIKDAVDIDPRPGRFLLTGSARILGLRELPDALPGRMETVTLWPFSQGELIDGPDRFIDAAFTQGADLNVRSALRKTDYIDLVLRGGFPEAVARTDPARRRRFFTSYTANLIDRDVRELSDIEYAGRVRQLLRLLAARSGQLLVFDALARELEVSTPTVRHYVELLELVFLIHRIPAWSSNLTTRVVGTPKVVVTDAGLAAHLVGQNAARLREPDGAFGPLLEGFVTMELMKQLAWSEEVVELFHFRTKDKVEVDVVLENAAGDVVAVEVKAGETVRSDDFRGLRYLANRLGSRFLAGFVLYAGQQTLPFGPRLRAVPVSALWTAEPAGT